MLISLNNQDFDGIYEIMEQSFPRDEIRPYNEQKALLCEKEYEIFAEYEGAEAAAFFSVWNFGDFAFVEHFAVKEKFRNGGRGARLLNELLELLGRLTVLEVERPLTDIAIRRIGFYERNSFMLNGFDYIQPPISKGRNSIPLLIMSTNRKVSADEYEKIKSRLYKSVYKITL